MNLLNVLGGVYNFCFGVKTKSKEKGKPKDERIIIMGDSKVIVVDKQAKTLITMGYKKV
ncbi:MAG: hypothetical protein LBD46_04545 [Endomicrobium sp.]|nr:hypothetical protein [Endomicrobium sp.]